MKMLNFFFGALFMTSIAQASIVCEGTIKDDSKIKVIFNEREKYVAVESDLLDKPSIYHEVSSMWDGHMTGLVTAPGFSMKYEDQYGCIRNVIVVTTFSGAKESVNTLGTLYFATCRGDSAHDDLCKK